MKYYLFGIYMLLVTGCTTQGNTADSQVKKVAAPEKVQICLACHGVDGIHGKAGVPPLGGRSYNDLVRAMHNVREASSAQPLLGHFLSDDDIKEVALYFSTLK